MKLQLERRDDCIILILHGEFDTFYCAPFLDKMEQLLDEGEERIALNMRKIKFINSTGLGTIIKASKLFTKNQGKVVVSSPSPVCRSVMESIGLNRVVPLVDNDEDAIDLLLGAAPPAKPSAQGTDLVDQEEAAILFSPLAADHLETFIPADQRKKLANPVHGHQFGETWRGVGRMLSVTPEGLRFAWDGGNTGLAGERLKQFLAPGTELQVKFRLPLFEKGRSEAKVQIDTTQVDDSGCRVDAAFTEIHAQTLEAVEQYSKDMSYLKQELKRTTEGDG